MPNDELKKLAETVQTLSEQWHCASAIYAIEQLLTHKLKEEYDSKIENLLNRLRNITNPTEHKDLSRRVLLLKLELQERIKATKIYVQYGDFIKDSNNSGDSARGVRSRNTDGSNTIVLPKKLQESIIEGVRLGNPDWEKLKPIKKELRRQTCHELGHVLVESFLGRNITEDEVGAFSDHLAKLREERSRKIDGYY